VLCARLQTVSAHGSAINLSVSLMIRFGNAILKYFLRRALHKGLARENNGGVQSQTWPFDKLKGCGD